MVDSTDDGRFHIVRYYVKEILNSDSKFRENLIFSFGGQKSGRCFLLQQTSVCVCVSVAICMGVRGARA